jgi:soluble lytic murein transglycosylase-like protein
MDLVKRLKVFVIATLLLPTCAMAAPISVEAALDQWQPLIVEAAHRFMIPAPWIRDVMRAESAGYAFIDDQPTISIAGAMGLMQIMPATYAELRDRYGLGDDPYDPRDNILAGAAYLHELYEHYGWPSLFAAYHAGPVRFEEYLSTGRPLPGATRRYLTALVPETAPARTSRTSAARAVSIFVRPNGSNHADEAAPQLQRDDRLFVRLHGVGTGTRTLDIDQAQASPEGSDGRLP